MLLLGLIFLDMRNEIYGSHPDPNLDSEILFRIVSNDMAPKPTTAWEYLGMPQPIPKTWKPLGIIIANKVGKNEWNNQADSVGWWMLMMYPYYTHYSLGQIPIFPAWLTQLRWLLEGKLLKHFALLQGFSWPMSQVWSGIRIMEI